MGKIKNMMLAAVICSFLMACTVFAEGDYVSAEDIAKIRKGDTFKEVKGKIGDPQWMIPVEKNRIYLPQKKQNPETIERTTIWFYQNGEQSPKIVIYPGGKESQTRIDEDGNVAYYTGSETKSFSWWPRIRERWWEPETKPIEMDQVIRMQKIIQRSRNEKPVSDYLVIFIDGKVEDKITHEY